MRKLFVFISVFILYTYAFTLLAQTPEQDDLRATCARYFKATEAKQIDSCLESIYPKFFDFFPRQILAAGLKKTFEDSTLNINMTHMAVEKISAPILYEGIQYALVDYSFQTAFQRKASQSQREMEMLVLGMTSVYGEKNVRLDSATQTIYVSFHNQMFAILDPAYKGWKFLEKKDELLKSNPDYREMYWKLVPKHILRKLS